MHPGSATFEPRVLMRVALGGALLLLSACGSRGGDSAGAPSASLTVTTGAPETRRIALDVVASGSVAAWQEMSLGVELSGVRVERVLVEVGARVKKGQALVLLDTRSLAVDARRAEASYAQAAANLQLARASATRGETLLARQLISASNFEELSAGRSKAEAQLASAAAERDAARLKLAFATLRAPEAGIVASRTVQPGQIVSVGVELLRLIRDGRLEWRADLSEADLVRVRPGARVFVKSPDGTPVEGSIRAISPGLDAASRTALVYADLPKPAGLRAGMFAEGRIELGEVEASVLPRESVVVRDGYSYVFVVGKEDRVAQRRIEVAPASGDVVPVRSGLAAGDRVVVKGAGFLSDGDVVKVVESAVAAAPAAAPAKVPGPRT